jgi:hypothetical protein
MEPITLGILDQDARLQYRLGEFFDEQRVPVGLSEDLFHHFHGQHAPAGHLRDHAFNIVAVQPTERQGADIGKTSPGRFELHSEGE